MTSLKAYDVLVSSMWGAKWIVSCCAQFCWARTVLLQREWKHSKLTDLGEKNVHERERERKTNCLYRGIEWETKRLRGQQGETERGRERGWEWWEQRGLLPTQYSVVHVWVSSNIYLICSHQAELCNSKAEAHLLDIILHKSVCFCFWKKCQFFDLFLFCVNI